MPIVCFTIMNTAQVPVRPAVSAQVPGLGGRDIRREVASFSGNGLYTIPKKKDAVRSAQLTKLKALLCMLDAWVWLEVVVNDCCRTMIMT